MSKKKKRIKIISRQRFLAKVDTDFTEQLQTSLHLGQSSSFFPDIITTFLTFSGSEN